jgi:hypothetical protein
MREIHIHDQNLIARILEIFHSDFPIVILEFKYVYGLMVPNNIKGLEAINKVKKRLPNKFYGSFLGDHDSFRQIIHPDFVSLFDKVLNAAEGSFLRLPIHNIKNPNQTCWNNMHQTLIESKKLKTEIELLEIEYKKEIKTSDFFMSNFQSPLISSLNVSGSSDGAITDKRDALSFGVINNIPLFIHAEYITQMPGSYPIFSFNKDGSFRIERHGVDDEKIRSNIQNIISNFQRV